jgi:ribosomal protein S18 acetylase RimI-like enzyme
MNDFYQVRQATQADLSAMEWDGEFSHFRRLYAEAYQQALNGFAVLWVAELPVVGLIGQAFVSLRSGRQELADGINRAYLYGFRVKPDYRGQGIGTQMMAVIESDLLGRGFRSVTLNVGVDNQSARRLYERLGYQVVGADPGRWSYIDDQGNQQNVNEPAWRMEKQLCP